MLSSSQSMGGKGQSGSYMMTKGNKENQTGERQKSYSPMQAPLSCTWNPNWFLCIYTRLAQFTSVLLPLSYWADDFSWLSHPTWWVWGKMICYSSQTTGPPESTPISNALIILWFLDCTLCGVKIGPLVHLYTVPSKAGLQSCLGSSVIPFLISAKSLKD